jgi:hypothetical protein
MTDGRSKSFITSAGRRQRWSAAEAQHELKKSQAVLQWMQASAEHFRVLSISSHPLRREPVELSDTRASSGLGAMAVELRQ